MTVFYSPSIARSGLVAYYDAANVKSYPGAGASWADMTINGNNSTLSGSPTFSNGTLYFPAADAGVDVPDVADIRLSDATFSFWFKLDNIASDHDLLNKGNHNTNEPCLIWFDPVVGGGDLGVGNVNCISAMAYDGATQHWISTDSNTIAAETYYNVVVVLEPSSNLLSIYINGILAKSNTKTYSGIRNINTTFKLCIAGNSINHLVGEMNIFSMYSRALTATEISQNFEATRGRYGI